MTRHAPAVRERLLSLWSGSTHLDEGDLGHVGQDRFLSSV